ncbi:catalase T NDAI_0G01320 [Naumovozyma dairenensis CBS 421]|uniref:Catalase n=1 Tax=Naumovozyma dairenensis (strain ATCC 10597 / BCRC 20456 / CBS 421 / NBRC 0211 / NRRL Y-12639) TaxID=1071378 RepID=G0WDP7_NAUDC|nr:hypothetical protein NDAI_0G01320 [Naumovozyma dairenensis CBS 421]CCD25908.2 hypothetical protein NDAI_0G01320 [Naumovozyma dairenensis CBS 421]
MFDDKSKKLEKPTVYALENGVAYPHHPYSSQYSRPDGPLLLQDINLIETLAHFDRERVPERVVHAHGGGCRVEFELTDSLSDITFAKPYQEVGYKFPGVVRFSTVGGEKGSADTVRDPRGASFKFYTPWGNHDWVFNNTPVFFIKDALKFPHFIHSQKRHPQTNLNAASDSSMYWDYLTQNPESIHQVTYMFGDRGIPKNWAEMSSYSGHAFKFINRKGEITYVQIHVKPEKDFTTLSVEEGNELAGSNPNYNQEKLYEQVASGTAPKLECFIQTMTPKQAELFRYSINDLTKIWPHKDFPLRKFGEIRFTENVENFFEEIEQIAFSPSNTCIPGIEPSNDPVLQSRLFSYPDTQRHRLGGNYNQLPVNRPRNVVCPVTGKRMAGNGGVGSLNGTPLECPYNPANYHRDGTATLYNYGNQPNFISTLPSANMKFANLTLDDDKVEDSKYQGVVLEDAVKADVKKQEEKFLEHENVINNKINSYTYVNGVSPLDFEQPRALYENVFNDDDKKTFVKNVVDHASTCKTEIVKVRVAQYFGLLNKDLGSQIAEGLKVPWKPVDFEGYAKAIGMAPPS